MVYVYILYINYAGFKVSSILGIQYCFELCSVEKLNREKKKKKKKKHFSNFSERSPEF